MIKSWDCTPRGPDSNIVEAGAIVGFLTERLSNTLNRSFCECQALVSNRAIALPKYTGGG